MLSVVLPSAHAAPYAPATQTDIVIAGDGRLVIDRALTGTASPSPIDPGSSVIIRVRGVLELGSGAVIAGGRGADGVDGSGIGTRRATDGGSGGSVTIIADTIISYGAHLEGGRGGDGGSAFAMGSPDASAFGGHGGAGGVVRIIGFVIGDIHVRSGDGGDGGGAQAAGAAGCSGHDGTSAEDNRSIHLPTETYDANANGTAGECARPDHDGGNGGDARAIGGDGGISQDGNGGRGGNATAIGGRGGDGMDACFSTNDAARASGIHRAGNGGSGGRDYARGGGGGPGIVGGHGGNAHAENGGGYGGNATFPIAPGVGGINVRDDPSWGPPGAVGGPGGPGNFGGAGGSAFALIHGVTSGAQCGPLPVKTVLDFIPAPGAWAGIVALGIVALISSRRR